MKTNKSKFLIMIQFGPSSDYKIKIREITPKVLKACKQLSNNDLQLAYSAADGSAFGVFITCDRKSGYICAAISGDTERDWGCYLSNDDSIVVTELGHDFGGRGAVKAWNWLQHR